MSSEGLYQLPPAGLPCVESCPPGSLPRKVSTPPSPPISTSEPRAGPQPAHNFHQTTPPPPPTFPNYTSLAPPILTKTPCPPQQAPGPSLTGCSPSPTNPSLPNKPLPNRALFSKNHIGPDCHKQYKMSTRNNQWLERSATKASSTGAALSM